MLFFGQRFPGEKDSETVRCRDATASSFVAKVRGEVFAHFHAVVVKRHCSVRNWLFSLPGRVLYEQPTLYRRTWWTMLWAFFLCISRPFRSWWVWTFRVQLILSSLKACLIIARASVALLCRFTESLMPFLCRIHLEIASGQIHDSGPNKLSSVYANGCIFWVFLVPWNLHYSACCEYTIIFHF
jgi:hypothetical protein